MGKVEKYVRAINRYCPDLALREMRLLDNVGQYNDILIINDELIFRFPKYSDGVEGLYREVDILRRVRHFTSLPVPNPIYTGAEESRLGDVFMGYTMLPGEPLTPDLFRTAVERGGLERIADQLSTFLVELHSIPVDKFGPNTPIGDIVAETEVFYAEVRDKLFAFMRADARGEVTDHFESFLHTPELHSYDPVLQHGDFGGTNILIDPNAGNISGVIDFGFAGIGDPALDLAAVSTLGDSFFLRFGEGYPITELLLRRAKFYKGTFALFEALHGVKSNDKNAFDAGMEEYV